VLLCPAWRRWGEATTVKCGTTILHSRADDVVPFQDSEDLVRRSGLSAEALVEVGSDHRLADPEPLEAMVGAVEDAAVRPGKRASVPESIKQAIVRHGDQVPPLSCPFGNVRRIVTGGEGGVANVHVVKITKGTPHVHTGYDEVYYVLDGAGSITLDGEVQPLRPGTVAVIPAGVVHSLQADQGQELEFIIFGTPPMPMDDDRAKPRSV
jgi:mannose-6-phosphate isomerase-like protein (cupin superfamily)